MPDEAILRIVLDASTAPTAPPPPPPPSPTKPASVQADPKQEAKAYSYGQAMPWAPPDQPIQAPVVEGLDPSQAEYLRMESEAARRGMSVHEYRKAEVEAGGAMAPPVAPTPPPEPEAAPPPEPEEDMQAHLAKVAAERAERLAKLRAERDAAEATTAEVEVEPPQPPPEPSDDMDGMEDMEEYLRNVKIPPPKVPQTSPQLAEVPTLDSAAAEVGPDEDDILQAIEKRIEEIESWMPQPGSAAAQKLEELKALLARGGQPEPAPAFDPLEMAKKRVEKEKQRALIDEEYRKLKPPPPPLPDPPFDPVEAARKRVKAEEQRAAVDAEYRKLKPPEAKSGLDNLLSILEDLRGTIGGTFGAVVGTVLDITAKIREMRGATEDVVAPATAAIPEAPPPSVPITEPETAAPTDVSLPTAPTAEVTTDAEPVAQVGDAVEATAKLGDSAAAAGSKMSAMVPVVGAVAVAAVAVVAAFKGLVNVANKMAERYGEFDPRIAQAQAQAEIRKTLGDIRRARESSNELAEFVRAQSEMQERWEDIKVAVMKQIIPPLTGILEVLGALLGIASQRDADEEDIDPTLVLLSGKVEVPEL